MKEKKLLGAIAELLDQKLDEKLDEKLDSKLKPLETNFQKLESDVRELKTDVQGLKSDVEGLKTNVQKMQTEIYVMKEDIHKINLFQENVILPRLNTIESCYTDTYKRYRTYNERMETAFEDIDMLKRVVANHSEKLQVVS